MATFTDTIRFVVEAVTGQAERNLKGVRDEVGKVDGAGGKISATLRGIGDTIQANMGAGLAAAGTALAGFAASAIDQFADTAREAGRLADTTGLATEEASRWLAVLRPLNVEGADLADILGNINTKASEGRLRELGIDAADSDERLKQVIETLGGITDETERAALASELLGEEGTRQLAPLIAKAHELRGALEGVSDAQVITDEEREKAAEFDETMRLLSDTMRDFSLTVAPRLIDALEDIRLNIEGITSAVEKIPDVPDWLGGGWGDILKRAAQFVPGGSAVIAGLEARERLFGGDTGGRGPGTPPPIYPPAPTIGTQIINMPPGVEGPEVDRNLASWFRYNGTGDWGSSP